MHITDVGDIPPKKEAVYDIHKHIKPSFFLLYAIKSLRDEADNLERQSSRRILSSEDKAKISGLRQRADKLALETQHASIPDNQYAEIWTHVIRCPECRKEGQRVRGDLPEGGLPF